MFSLSRWGQRLKESEIVDRLVERLEAQHVLLCPASAVMAVSGVKEADFFDTEG